MYVEVGTEAASLSQLKVQIDTTTLRRRVLYQSMYPSVCHPRQSCERICVDKFRIAQTRESTNFPGRNWITCFILPQIRLILSITRAHPPCPSHIISDPPNGITPLFTDMGYDSRHRRICVLTNRLSRFVLSWLYHISRIFISSPCSP